MNSQLFALHLHAIRRRWPISLLLIVMALTSVMAAQTLQQSINRQQKALDGMKEQSNIRCIVTTAAGSINGVDLPVAMVEELTGRKESDLSTCADNVNALAEETLAKPSGLILLHILSLDSDPALQSVNGAIVQFYDGWSETDLRGEAPICLLPTELKDLAEVDEDGNLTLEVCTSAGLPATLQVVGDILNTHVQAAYCPFFLPLGGAPVVKTCSFHLPEGINTEQVKAVLYRRFVEPGPEAKGIGLLVQDSHYSLAWQQLSGNLRMLELLRPILLVFIGVIGAFGSWLTTHGRRKELAVMRCQGLKRRSIFALLLVEHTVLAVLGGALGFVVSYLVNGAITGAAAAYSGAILVAFLLGAAMSGLRETRVNVIELMKVEG